MHKRSVISVLFSTFFGALLIGTNPAEAANCSDDLNLDGQPDGVSFTAMLIDSEVHLDYWNQFSPTAALTKAKCLQDVYTKVENERQIWETECSTFGGFARWDPPSPAAFYDYYMHGTFSQSPGWAVCKMSRAGECCLPPSSSFLSNPMIVPQMP